MRSPADGPLDERRLAHGERRPQRPAQEPPGDQALAGGLLTVPIQLNTRTLPIEPGRAFVVR